jgi:N-acetylmuramoyl-L-alanine amidase
MLKRKVEDIDTIIVHCSDSDHHEHDNIETIRKWHVEDNGWSDIGYHFVITQDGTVRGGRNFELVGAHTKGMNETSLGVCLTGKEKFSHNQMFSLAWLISDLTGALPNITRVLPHNYFASGKMCPNFNLKIFDTSREIKKGGQKLDLV